MDAETRSSIFFTSDTRVLKHGRARTYVRTHCGPRLDGFTTVRFKDIGLM